MEENKKSNACNVIGKILMIVGLAAVVATIVTLLCKKICAKTKEKQCPCEADESAVDDYDVCCYDSDDLDDSVGDDVCEDGESDVPVTEETTDNASYDETETD